jgi:hypothetical protein
MTTVLPMGVLTAASSGQGGAPLSCMRPAITPDLQAPL